MKISTRRRRDGSGRSPHWRWFAGRSGASTANGSADQSTCRGGSEEAVKDSIADSGMNAETGKALSRSTFIQWNFAKMKKTKKRALFIKSYRKKNPFQDGFQNRKSTQIEYVTEREIAEYLYKGLKHGLLPELQLRPLGRRKVVCRE